MTKYIVLLAGAEGEWGAATSADRDRWIQAHIAFDQAVGKHQLCGEALGEAASATTLRRRTGTTVLTDGPYAETAEQLGGFYLVEADNLDQVVAWCEILPEIYSIEIRPCVDVELPD